MQVTQAGVVCRSHRQVLYAGHTGRCCMQVTQAGVGIVRTDNTVTRLLIGTRQGYCVILETSFRYLLFNGF